MQIYIEPGEYKIGLSCRYYMYSTDVDPLACDSHPSCRLRYHL